MKLQTKLILGFSLVLFMTLALGGASYYLTDEMSRFSGRLSALYRLWERQLCPACPGTTGGSQKAVRIVSPHGCEPRKQAENVGLHQAIGGHSAGFTEMY